MNFISSLLILFGFVAHCWCIKCTDSNLGAPVPAEICNPANCAQLTKEELVKLGSYFVKPLIWNKGVRSYVGYCRHKYPINITLSTCNTGKLDVVSDFIRYYGPRCNTSSTGRLEYTAEEDAVTGKIKVLTFVQDGSTWETCFPLYDNSTGSRVYRSCKVDPPPPAGEGYAHVYVELEENTDEPSDEFLDFIDNSGIDWAESVDECTV